MLYEGYYYNWQGAKIEVRILTGADRSETITIGDDKSDDSTSVTFTDNPVETEAQADTTFDHLLCQRATVRLLCRSYHEDLYSSTCRNAVVNIHRDGTCIFAGYVEPMALSQGYNEDMDEVELTCVDCLSALQYSNYKDIGSAGISYDEIKAKAEQRTFLDIISEVVKGVAANIDMVKQTSTHIYYDRSKALTSESDATKIFEQMSLDELLFLGDEEDDVWTQQDVLEKLLMYLNLHIMQVGRDFYVFAWETLRKGKVINWKDILSSQVVSTVPQTIEIVTDRVADLGTQIEVAETYNYMELTDSVTEIDNVVESPLDSDSITAAFGNYQKYMTEYIAEGEGIRAIKAFKAMVTGESTDWEDASQVDWFAWVKNNTSWKFYHTAADGTRQNIADTYFTEKDQQKVLTEGLRTGIGAVMVATGSIEKKNGGNDNTPVTSIDMQDNFVVAVNGIDDSDRILAACPVAEYIGNTAGGDFSPADDDTTNYIVISGKLALNPLMDVTDGYENLKWVTNYNQFVARWWHKTQPSRNNDDGRYYAQRFYKAETWKDTPGDDTTANTYKDGADMPLVPFTGTGPQEYQFKYSAVGDYTDNISKVGVLQCMLVIGDKCVVELLPEDGGSGNGEPTDYVWRTYKERSECKDDDEYYAQSFAVGVDPKLKDYIIGTEFDIQKNAPYTLGITADGTAIPIKRTDKVSGKVKFQILGPVNEEWNEVTRRHPSFWRHTKWSEESVPLLKYTKSIVMRDFEIKVVSDNGLMGASDDNDIVYMSDTAEEFVNKKDDLEFKITTALTSAECKELGVTQAVKMSSPHNVAEDEALLGIYDKATETTAKPEQIYVDAYWKEWHEPRVIMTQNFKDGDYVSPWNLYIHPAMGKTFHVEGISRNLTEGTAEVQMKEVF